MADLPKQVSESFKKRNAHLYRAVTIEDIAKSIIPAERFDELAKEINATRLQFSINYEPMPAPRLTQRDKWLKPRRKCVQNYFDYRAVVQGVVGDLPSVPDEIRIVFYVSMPDSWSGKKQAEMMGKPHRQRGDVDNLCKSILDALFLHDGGVWKLTAEKRWTDLGHVEIEMVWL